MVLGLDNGQAVVEAYSYMSHMQWTGYPHIKEAWKWWN